MEKITVITCRGDRAVASCRPIWIFGRKLTFSSLNRTHNTQIVSRHHRNGCFHIGRLCRGAHCSFRDIQAIRRTGRFGKCRDLSRNRSPVRRRLRCDPNDFLCYFVARFIDVHGAHSGTNRTFIGRSKMENFAIRNKWLFVVPLI